MTTARTHRMGLPRPKKTTPNTVPVSAERFAPDSAPDIEAEEVEVFDPSTLDFDPGEHNVDEVQDYVTERPETASAILELESEGKNRSTLVGWLIEFEPDTEDETDTEDAD